ncbi:DNA-directed RNA polymerase I subunit RPA2 [Agrilus planipennis]|uniref:DNA-directed RNA polymerase n=1 Tax=Agrilus planipennis TaxID=224129 RepID=A0A1W4XHB8_AGRPL|nr:DNA-directed RNA polymerase I subunit RPA2 [Agrilus planipennis]
MSNPTLRHLTDPKFGKPAKHQNNLLQQLGTPHISSFNYMVDRGLEQAVADIIPVQFEFTNGDKICLKIEEAALSCPLVPVGTIGVKKQVVLPTECRQRAATYKGKFNIKVSWTVNNGKKSYFEKELGEVPIMLKSNRCHLNLMSPKQLVKNGEHEDEWGGYFVVKGHERLVRMLLMTRRNYPLTIKRSSWKERGELFSDVGVSIRCVREDQTAQNNVLHFLTDGSAKFMFIYLKNLYYIPLMIIMKCLCDYTDKFIFEKLTEGHEDDLYYIDCIQNMLRACHLENLHTQEDCKEYVGKLFRVRFLQCPTWYTNQQITDFMLKQCILIHLDNNTDKFNLLVFMTQKLFAFAQDKCKHEGVDSVMMQEILLGGHLYLQILKERLQGWLNNLRLALLKRPKTDSMLPLSSKEVLIAAKHAGTIESSMEQFFATGNVKTATGLGLMQDKGLVIMAENINRMRYMSHFKAVHRGAFFQEMRTTEVRQLLPDAWGFICPVHTPDGAPCGLLNHLTMNCTVTDAPDPVLTKNIPRVLARLGMVPLENYLHENRADSYVTVVDGKVVGYVPVSIAKDLVDNLRLLKIQGKEIPITTEIALLPRKKVTGQYPGLFLFTGPARMMRPLVNLSARNMEFVGTLEQINLDISVTPDEIYKGVTTHMEPSKSSFLSNLAQLIPMPDTNQSPRNMYQCQMGKQTMGTPCHTWSTQAETKIYRLQTPASPLFRPVHYDNIKLDDFPMGTNAVVAVISYTGYDMEDAMIINRSAYERGFAYGSIYKAQFIELDHVDSYFCRDPSLSFLVDYLDTDGLPHPGVPMSESKPMYCYYSAESCRYVVQNFKGKEDCFVDNVRVCGNFNNTRAKKIACIVFRVPRNPTVGDKFASRAGQKGICSQLWPAEDLPFTETGMFYVNYYM